MKFILLSISVLWVGVHWCAGNTLSQVELKHPSELVYKVEDDTDGQNVKFSAPNVDGSTLREIIYNLIEKENGDTKDTSEPDQPMNGDGVHSVRKDIKDDGHSHSDGYEVRDFADVLEEAFDQDSMWTDWLASLVLENAPEQRIKRDISENDKNGDSQDGLNTKMDDILDNIMNNEKVWSFMDKLGAQYLDSMTEHTAKLIKEEVDAQVKKYFVNHKQVVDKEPALNGVNIEENDMNEPGNDETETTNKSIRNGLGDNFSINVHGSTINGNTVGRDKITNMYFGCSSRNADEILKNIKSLGGGTNSINTINFITYEPAPSPVDINEFKDTPDQNPDVNNNEIPSDLPTVTEEDTDQVKLLIVT